MLHLEDEGGDHSIFLSLVPHQPLADPRWRRLPAPAAVGTPIFSLDRISSLEFPLLALKKSMENEQEDYVDDSMDDTLSESEDSKSVKRSRKQNT